jgi:TolA-binding protein
MKTTVSKAVVLAMAMFAMPAAKLMAQDATAGPEQLRLQARRLEEQASELKADGEQDKATAVRRQAEKLRRKAREVEQGGTSQSAEAREAQPGGPGQEPGMIRPGERGERRLPGGGRRLGIDGAGEPRERLEHLRMAIEHLHAAGLHEPADRLERALRRMQASMAGPDNPELRGRGSKSLERERRQGPGPETDQGGAELQQLRKELRQLRERLERLERLERP